MSLFCDLYNEDCITGAQTRLDDDSIDLLICDPDFGIQGDQFDKHYNRDASNVVGGYVGVSKKNYPQFTLDWIKQAERVLRPGGTLVIIIGYTPLPHVYTALAQTNLREINHMIWKYNFGVYTKNKFVSSHYHLLYLVKPPISRRTFNSFARFGGSEKTDAGRSKLYGDLEDVWTINKEYQPGRIKNQNQLPSELIIKIVQYLSNPYDVVGDFFMGSFQTAIVAKGMQRHVVGFELNKIAFDTCVPRVAAVQEGVLLHKIRMGTDDTPANAGKPWNDADLRYVVRRAGDLHQAGKTKKDTVAIIAKELQRGEWSIKKLLQ